MTVADVVRAIRARWLLFTVCCIVPIAGGLCGGPRLGSGLQRYSRAFRRADQAGRGRECLPERLFGDQLAQQQTPSYASLVDSPAVLRAVIADLHLATTPSQLSGQVSATSPLNSVLIDITASGGSATAARDIANDTALRFAGLAEGMSGSILGHV